eukprot:Ihof_evm2s32 gene=Ihof_evmTU2s32
MEDHQTILDTIFAQRQLDVAAAKARVPASDLEALISNPNTCFPISPLISRLRQSIDNPSRRMSLWAEIKRASPSKGMISKNMDATKQSWKYAQGGADVISVLTEPKWFGGGLHDLRAVRDMLHRNMTNDQRPCILRKDFIFDSYQLLEARAYGADTVLLIVKMLDDATLTSLMAECRNFGMEPLVEVNNKEEMDRAVRAGAIVIGVNNRNLDTFQVDLSTTNSLAHMTPPNALLIALSGIKTRQDVADYKPMGIKGVLVGESLMKADNPRIMIGELLGMKVSREMVDPKSVSQYHPLVKICGVRTVKAALVAAREGADMIGLIFVKGKRREVTLSQARSIIQSVHVAKGYIPGSIATPQPSNNTLATMVTFRKPIMVGVFQNQSVDVINQTVHTVGLDVVQLHGQETVDEIARLDVPVIKVVHVTPTSSLSDVIHDLTQWENVPNVCLVLLDTQAANGQQGGSGAVFDWNIALQCVHDNHRIMIAGGLTPDNISDAVNK